MLERGAMEKLNISGVAMEDYLPYLEESIANTARIAQAADQVTWRGKLFLKAEQLAVKATEKGLKRTHQADTAVRGVAYFGQQARFEDAYKKLGSTMGRAGLTLGKDMPSKYMVNRFLEDSGARGMYELDQRWVLQTLFRAPNTIVDRAEDVAHRMAYRLQEDTNWIYRAGHRPGIISDHSPLGSFAKLFGQFGVWSANFAYFMRDMLRQTFRSSPRAGATALTRWVIGNAALQEGGEALGIDASNWLWFSPLDYTGGPIVNDIIMGLNAEVVGWTSGDDTRNPMASIARAQIKKGEWALNFAPGYGFYKDIGNALEEWHKADPDNFMEAATSGALQNTLIRFLGFPAAKQSSWDRLGQESQMELRRRLAEIHPEGSRPQSLVFGKLPLPAG
jgi:hypothetical protein